MNQNQENLNLDLNNSDSYYLESKLFKNEYRPIRKNTNQMLNAYPDKKVLVKLRNVDIEYGSGVNKFRAINDLSLNIYKGEVLGLVGESGSGKSTTGRAIVGLTPYSHGTIQLGEKLVPRKFKRGFKFGKKLKEYKSTLEYMANKVQMIFQDPANSLNPNKNIEKVVSEGLVNLKNAKEIYLYNEDQRVFAKLYNELNNLNPQEYNKEFFEQVNLKLNINSKVAYDLLYVNLYNELKDKYADTQMLKAFEEEKQNRDVISEYSEAKCRDILVVQTLKSVGLDESVLKRFPLEFSGGQQQRIGISRSVILRPELLVADEPISALDVSIQAQVVNIFNDFKDKYGLTILFIAHDLRMVEYISDRIAVIYKGVLLEIGETAQIMKNPIHPYTKSLLDAVPSIESKKGSLIGFKYDAKMHSYTQERQPYWHNIGQNHFVLAADDEIQKWLKGDYSSYIDEQEAKVDPQQLKKVLELEGVKE
ncbi:ABC transporter ATP-binding protein [Mycoplasmopsis ciconiae]|uniref:ABC transporter ATP-binding protein n=1 Tax=Mycoplasmopsis ciconiae TaxID=561067 RepID=A0ABU7MLV2_9BACT|nr:ABC transporter ATP-binding protein [Mycoplasmopsis ciconiae]